MSTVFIRPVVPTRRRMALPLLAVVLSASLGAAAAMVVDRVLLDPFAGRSHLPPGARPAPAAPAATVAPGDTSVPDAATALAASKDAGPTEPAPTF